MRRPRGEAGAIILEALRACPEGFCDMTLAALLEATGLPAPTLRDNVPRMMRAGQIETYRDDNNDLWVRIPE